MLSSDEIALVRIKTKPETFPRRFFGTVDRVHSALTAENNTFLECEKRERRLFQVHGDCEALSDLFPNVAVAYGSETLCELAELSYLVGMECPGLYSLFSGFNAAFGLNGSDSQIIGRIENLGYCT